MKHCANNPPSREKVAKKESELLVCHQIVSSQNNIYIYIYKKSKSSKKYK